MDSLLLSIITINLNNKVGLEKTVLSVRDQDFFSFEHIVIDGGSGDGSVEFIIQNEKYFSHWISEKDNGIYHAMNKGIERARGKYLYFLNSGDFLINPGVLSSISASFKDDIHLISFDVEVIKNLNSLNGKIWKTKSNYRFSEIAFGHLPHQGFIFDKSLFQIFGCYNENNRIVSDWEFFLKLIYNNVSIAHVDLVGAVHYLDGVSQDEKNLTVQYKERDNVLKSYSSLYDDLLIMQSGSSLKKLLLFKLRNGVNLKRHSGKLKKS